METADPFQNIQTKKKMPGSIKKKHMFYVAGIESLKE
jgi:hypothetical protein